MHFLYTEEVGVQAKLNAVELVRVLKSSSAYIRSVYILNERSDYILTNSGAFTYGDFPDKDILEFLENDVPSLSPTLFLTRFAPEELVSAAVPETVPVWSLVFHSKRPGSLVINIDAEKLSSFRHLDGTSGEIFLLNHLGNVMASTDSMYYGKEFPYETLLQDISLTKKDYGSHMFHDNSQKLATWSKTSDIGLITLKITSCRMIDTTNGMLIFSFLISLGYLLICLLFSIIASRRLYAPIASLNAEIREIMKGNGIHPAAHRKNMDEEFLLFQGIYSSLYQEKSLLMDKLTGYRNLAHSIELSNFLQGGFGAITSLIHTELELLFEHKNYIVLYIMLEYGNDPDAEKDIGLLMYVVGNVADELFAPYFFCVQVPVAYDKVCYILNYDTSVDIREPLQILGTFIKEHYKASLVMGLSSPIDDFDNLPSAMQEAKADAELQLSDREEPAETELSSSSIARIQMIDNVKDMVARRIEDPELSVISLAADVHLSVNYLRRIFREIQGESLSKYINERKVEAIKDLLQNTSLSMQEISDRTGFTAKTYFFSFFKKHVGMTPAAYRKAEEEKLG